MRQAAFRFSRRIQNCTNIINPRVIELICIEFEVCHKYALEFWLLHCSDDLLDMSDMRADQLLPTLASNNGRLEQTQECDALYHQGPGGGAERIAACHYRQEAEKLSEQHCADNHVIRHGPASLGSRDEGSGLSHPSFLLVIEEQPARRANSALLTLRASHIMHRTLLGLEKERDGGGGGPARRELALTLRNFAMAAS